MSSSTTLMTGRTSSSTYETYFVSVETGMTGICHAKLFEFLTITVDHPPEQIVLLRYYCVIVTERFHISLSSWLLSPLLVYRYVRRSTLTSNGSQEFKIEQDRRQFELNVWPGLFVLCTGAGTGTLEVLLYRVLVPGTWYLPDSNPYRVILR